MTKELFILKHFWEIVVMFFQNACAPEKQRNKETNKKIVFTFVLE